MAKFTVLVADDHPIFRKGLVALLSDISELEVIAEASDGLEAYRKILALRPSLAILDYEMPTLKGLDVIHKLRHEKNQTWMVMLTMHREKNFFREAMENGAKGYLLKENAISELKTCILKVLSGGVYTTPGLESLLVENEREEVPAQLGQLTATEKIILKLISENKSSADIASLLFISPNTVENHRGNMMKKLQLEGKNALLKFALQYRGSL